MKLVTYRAGADEAGRLGVLHDDLVVDVEWLGDSIAQGFPSTMLDLIDLGPDALRALQTALVETENVRAPGVAVPAANVKLLAPIPRPRSTPCSSATATPASTTCRGWCAASRRASRAVARCARRA